MRDILFGGVLLITSVICARAEERITSFHSRIEVMKDASVRVTENIGVIAEGRAISHGIYRDLPLFREGHAGKISYDILSVRRNGRNESYSIVTQGGMKRIYIGSAYALVSGQLTYEITYTSPLQVSLFDDFDEIYWNVTGNEWLFPIEKASAEVVLPEGSAAISGYGYTGPKGAKGDLWTSGITSSGMEFSTTAPLRVGEGFTVAVGFPKGFIIPPTGAVVWQFALDYALFGLLPPLLLLGYFLVVWRRAGKDPEVGPVIPEYGPPRGMSAAAIAYFMANEKDYFRGAGGDGARIRASAVISLCVKGYLAIERKGEGFGFFVRNGKPGAPPLEADEAAFLQSIQVQEQDLKDALFMQKSLGLGRGVPENGGVTGWGIYRASSDMVAVLRKKFRLKFVDLNFYSWFRGAVLAIVMAVVSFRLLAGARWDMPNKIAFVVLMLPTGFFGILLSGLMPGLSVESDKTGRALAVAGKFAVAIFILSFFCLPIGGGGEANAWALFILGAGFACILRDLFWKNRMFYAAFLMLPFAGFSGWFHFMRMVPVLESVSIASMAIILGVFSWLMLRPAETFLQLRNRLLGFRHYLVMAEKERLAFAHPLGMTPEVFERFLPFALALGVENEWAEAFAEVLGKYRPEWDVQGVMRGDYVQSIHNMAEHFVPAYGLTDSPSSYALSRPSSSSGSGSSYGGSSSGSSSSGSSGGGSSGGGGGGGGGGGW